MATQPGTESAGGGEVNRTARIGRIVADFLVILAVPAIFVMLARLGYATDAMLERDRDREKAIAVAVRRVEENVMQWTVTYQSADGEVVVRTNQGQAPSAVLVSADENVPANETPEAALDRHRARVLRAKTLCPEV